MIAWKWRRSSSSVAWSAASVSCARNASACTSANALSVLSALLRGTRFSMRQPVLHLSLIAAAPWSAVRAAAKMTHLPEFSSSISSRGSGPSAGVAVSRTR